MVEEDVDRHEAVVVGAGAGGLAAAAMLQRGVEPLVLEQAATVGESWRQHYDRLHLHTIRWFSGLPGPRIPRREGPWVSRDGVADYLQEYARHHRLRLRFGARVDRLDRLDGGWGVHTRDGLLWARWVVVATGYNRVPWLPEWPGREEFRGELIHSSQYRNPRPYRGKDVLVVGTGNSGAEIVVDLVEGGARRVSLSVRTPPNILPRRIVGVPTQVVGLLMRHLPVPVVDAVARVTQRVVVGDLSPSGMPPPPRGVYRRLVEDDLIPILDVGLIPLPRARRVRVVPAVEALDGEAVLLADGTRVRPDAVIASTGFRRGLEPLVGHLGILGRHGRPAVHGPVASPGAPGLYFIGYTNPISGNLREFGIDARRIAREKRSAGLRSRSA